MSIDDAKAERRHAVHVERQDERARLAELEAEVSRLNGQIAEWSRQNLAIIALEVKERKRAEAAERQLAELESEVERLKEHCDAWATQYAEARAALMCADARLLEHGDTTTHPVRCAIYAALAQTGEGGP